jgi:hypothetical protein
MLLIHCAITAEILTGKWNVCCMFSTTVNPITAPYLYRRKYTPPPLLSSFPTLAQLGHLVDIKDGALASLCEVF